MLGRRDYHDPSQMQPKPKNPSVDKPELYRALAASRSSFVSTGVFSFFINVLMLAPIIYMLERC